MGQLIADLDSSHFSVRRNAAHQLEELQDLAEAALRKALQGKPSLEVRLRIELLLKKLHGLVPTSARLRELRAVEALERMGTSHARQILTTLATGLSEARLTQEAKASLARLARRPTIKP